MIALALLFMQQTNAEDLLTIYKQALEADPMLRVAQLKTDVADAQSGQAGGQLLPQINANVNLSLNESVREGLGEDAYKGERYNVSFTQSLIDLPKYFNWRRYEELAEQSWKEYIDAWQSLMLDVVERYFDVLEANDVLALVQQEKESTVKQLQQYRKRYNKRLIKITDVYEIEAKLDGLKADESEAETNYILAKEGLTQLTGRKYETLYRLRQDAEFLSLSGDLQHWIDVAKNLNPALQAKQQSISAAKSDLAQQRSKHLPVVDLQLNYYRSNTGFQNTATSDYDTKVAALNINVPLFSGGSTSKRADEAFHNLHISKQDKVATLRAVIKEVRDAYLSTNASVRRIHASEEGLKSALKLREAMERGFKYGVQTSADVLISQDRAFKAKKDLLMSRYAYVISKIRLQRAVGKLNEQSLIEINDWLQPLSTAQDDFVLVSEQTVVEDLNKLQMGSVIRVTDQAVSTILNKAALVHHDNVSGQSDVRATDKSLSNIEDSASNTIIDPTLSKVQRRPTDSGSNEALARPPGKDSKQLPDETSGQGVDKDSNGVSAQGLNALAIETARKASSVENGATEILQDLGSVAESPDQIIRNKPNVNILVKRPEVAVSNAVANSGAEFSVKHSEVKVSGKFSDELIEKLSDKIVIIRQD